MKAESPFRTNVERPSSFILHRSDMACVDFLRRIGRAVLDFCYHSSAFGVSREWMRQRAELEAVLMILIVGDDLGVPIFPSFAACRLWPYLLPRMTVWKRALLRPKGPGGW